MTILRMILQNAPPRLPTPPNNFHGRSPAHKRFAAVVRCCRMGIAGRDADFFWLPEPCICNKQNAVTASSRAYWRRGAGDCAGNAYAAWHRSPAKVMNCRWRIAFPTFVCHAIELAQTDPNSGAKPCWIWRRYRPPSVLYDGRRAALYLPTLSILR